MLAGQCQEIAVCPFIQPIQEYMWTGGLADHPATLAPSSDFFKSATLFRQSSKYTVRHPYKDLIDQHSRGKASTVRTYHS
jgi:hypothetical protein